jgi:hypothetical protein
LSPEAAGEVNLMAWNPPFHPPPHSPCHVRLKEKEKKTIGPRLEVQNSLLEGIAQFAAQREVFLISHPKQRGCGLHIFRVSRLLGCDNV